MSTQCQRLSISTTTISVPIILTKVIMNHSTGDQHKSNGGPSANPFEVEPHRVSEYTAQEIATLQSRLGKQLGPEYISSRPGAAGQKVHYLAAEKVINLANEVFGFNGWSSAVKVITIDFVDEHPQTGKISLGLSVIVRVTLRDGTFHEDVGYGHIENCKGKAAAFEKAKKEGTTDGLKRALRTFGNVLGNCIYDKDFLGKVTKIKIAPSKWDADNLHRHPDFAPVRKEPIHEDSNPQAIVAGESTSPTEGDDEFGITDFSDADFSENNIGHPDEVVLPAEPQLPPAPVRPTANILAPNRSLEQSKPLAPNTHPSINTPSRQPQARLSAPPVDYRGAQRQPMQGIPPQQRRPLAAQQATSHTSQHLTAPRQASGQPPHQNAQLPNPQQPPPVGFYSARAATALNEPAEGATTPVSQFNPHAESPSIRKTVGIDHSRSVPVKRAGMGVAETPPAPLPGFPEGLPAPPRDFINPSSDMHRRIGAPPGPMPNSIARGGGMHGSAYRPPSRRGPMDATAHMAAAGPQAHGPGQSGPAGMKRPLPGELSKMHPDANVGAAGAPPQGQGPTGPAGTKRPPLGDLSNTHPSKAANQGGGDGGNDLKRRRTSGPENILPPQQALPGSR